MKMTKEVWVILLVEGHAISKFKNAMVAMIFWNPPEMLKEAQDRGLPVQDGSMICEDGNWRRTEEGYVESRGITVEMDSIQTEVLRKTMRDAAKHPGAIVVIESADGVAFKFTRIQVEKLAKDLGQMPSELMGPMN